MKDSQIIILTSFLTALKLHQEALPHDLITQLQKIAKNLETQVIELDAIAENYPTLNHLYHSAYQSLLSRSSQIKMLIHTPVVISKKNDADLITKAISILSSNTPTDAAKQMYNFDYRFEPDAPPIWEIVSQLGAQIPDEEWEKVPTDLSKNFEMVRTVGWVEERNPTQH